MSSLGVVVFNLRGMKHLSQCLDSVQWADAVTVQDLDRNANPNSINETERLCEEIKTDWVLYLWGEEKVGTELREELNLVRQAELQTSPLFHSIPIRSFLLGRWVKGSLWGPSPSCRLCRQGVSPSVSWWDSDREVYGNPSRLLRSWIDDYSCAELRDGVERVNQISSLWAERLRSEGRTLSTASISLYPLRVLMRLLITNGLFFEGLAGLSLSSLAAYATLVSGMKWWETHRSIPG